MKLQALVFSVLGLAGGVLGSNPPHSYNSAGTLRSPSVTYNNTLASQRADPHIVKHTDGYYYFTATYPTYDRLVLRRSETIQGLSDAEEVVIFNQTESGPGSGVIWAPELHYIDDKWYMYMAVGVSKTEWKVRAFVLEGDGENPLEANWTSKGLIETNWDTYSLDMSFFIANGERYLVWAQADPARPDVSTALFIARMVNPWTVELPAVAISYPDLDWERRNSNVNEGAYVIKRNGTIYLAYSAAATDHNYCLGLLTASENANLTDPASWTKSQEPVFQSSPETSQWGPGHHSYTISEDNLSDIIVYHDRWYKDVPGNPLDDPNRRTRVQKLYWKSDNTPNWGIPVPDGPTPVRFRLAADEKLYVRHRVEESAIVDNEDSPIAETQFRIVEPGLAGEGTVSLESTNMPGSFLRVSKDTLVLTAQNNQTCFDKLASFKLGEGLDGQEESISISHGDKHVIVEDESKLAVRTVNPGEEGMASFFTE